MAGLSSVQFGLALQGVTDRDGQMVGVIQVHHPDLLDRVMGVVEQQLSPTVTQNLFLYTSRDPQGPFKSQAWCWMNPDILPKLKVSLDVLSADPEASRDARMGNIYNTAVPRTNHPVTISTVPPFEEGRLYRLTVEQNDQGDSIGNWSVEPLQEEDLEVRRCRERDREHVVEGVRGFLRHLDELPGSADKELETLQQQLETAVDALEAARADWKNKEGQQATEALLAKQKRITVVISLIHAIQAKGGTIPDQINQRIVGQSAPS